MEFIFNIVFTRKAVPLSNECVNEQRGSSFEYYRYKSIREVDGRLIAFNCTSLSPLYEKRFIKI